MPMGMSQGHGHQVQLPVDDAGLGDHRLGKGLHGRGGPAQDHGLDAVIVVQVGMGGGHRQLVVLVLHLRQAQGQLARVVLVQVAQRGHAGAIGPVAAAHRSQVVAQQVAKGLRAVVVAARAHQRVEGLGQLIVEGHRQALHRPHRTA